MYFIGSLDFGLWPKVGHNKKNKNGQIPKTLPKNTCISTW
jgi:hypothetical protein